MGVSVGVGVNVAVGAGVSVERNVAVLFGGREAGVGEISCGIVQEVRKNMRRSINFTFPQSFLRDGAYLDNVIFFHQFPIFF